MNDYARKGIPFLFILDFDLVRPMVIPLLEAADRGILFDINGMRNYTPVADSGRHFEMKKYPLSYTTYKKAFGYVQAQQAQGNSFLTNLTFPTRIEVNISLREIFLRSRARYKLLLPGQFVVFSPEKFVGIQKGIISSHPMKGTIDADVPNAEAQLIEDPKERAEHYTIVDLIRNDLARVATEVRVERFRYLEKIHTHRQTLLQTSSEIRGRLPRVFERDIGTLLARLLPAGSVTGAPKKKTVEIIKAAEQYDRGYYTGVFGYYQHGIMESGVMIRFIQQQGQLFYFKSGGGITAQSTCRNEYQELIDKVYVPIDRKHQSSTGSGL